MTMDMGHCLVKMLMAMGGRRHRVMCMIVVPVLMVMRMFVL
jgi:hypothetical protein